MASMDLAALNYMLKELYSDRKVFELTYKKHPLLAMLTKFEKFGGKYRPIPVVWNRPSGRSQDFTKSRANRQPTEGVEFMLTRKRDYANILMDNEAIEAAVDDPMSFLRAKTLEINGMLEKLSRSLAISLYGDGSGIRAQVSTGQNVALTVVTLEDPNDIVFFDVNDTINLVSAAGALRVGDATIDEIDEDAGSFTLDAALNTIAGATAGDSICIDGDFGAMVSGLQAWLPGSAVTNVPFYGIDRTVHKRKLAGVSLNGVDGSYEEVLKDLISRMNRVEAEVDVVLVNDAVFTAIDKSQESKVMRTDPGKSAVANIGISGLWVNSKRGPVEVIPDVLCPADKMFALQKNTWELASLGRAPRIFDTDGLTMLRAVDSDAVEVRAQYYANLSTNAPGLNGVATITPPDPA